MKDSKPNAPPKPSDSARKSFLDAQRVWDSREASIAATAKTWKTVAGVALGIALISVCGNVWIGAQNKLVPYVVEVDKEGVAVSVRRVTRTHPQDENMIRFMLARFVRDWRSVYVDAAAQHIAIESAYSMLPSGTAANMKVIAWLTENSPFKRAESETVTVTTRSVLRLTAQTIQVQWDETRHSRSGEWIDTHRLQANISTVFKTPSTESEILKNPIGLYLEDIHFTEVFEK